MSSLFGFSLGALSPWFLLGIPLGAALLVYRYRARGAAPERVISSLLIVRQLPERLTARRRFVPPLQFWIELAAISLLSLAAAGITVASAARSIAIVVDSSLSMQARLSSGARRIDDAKRLAGADAVSMLGRATFSVFSAASALSRVAGPAASPASAAAAVQDIAATHEADALSEAIRSLLADGSFDEVWVYSDKPLAPSSDVSRVRLTAIPVEAASQQNAWIRSLSLAATGALSAEVALIGKDSAALAVSAQCHAADGSPAGGVVRGSAAVARGTPHRIELGRAPAGAAWCRVTADIPSGSLDLLPADNEGWVVRAYDAPPIQVISPLSERDLGLQRISAFSFVQLPSVSSPAFRPDRPAIVHRAPLPAAMQAPLFAVYPPEGSLPWGGSSTASEPKAGVVTRWEHSHPLMRYVNPTLISLPAARVLSCPAGSQQVLSSSLGGLACAGESGGNRYLVTGFEIFPFEGAASPTISIFTLNAISWLVSGGPTGAASSAQGPLSLPAQAKEAHYLAPQGASISPSAPGSAAQPGVVSYQLPGDPQARLSAVNGFSDEESDLSRPHVVSLPASEASKAGSRGRQPWNASSWLAALAVLALLADLLLRARRRLVWGAQ